MPLSIPPHPQFPPSLDHAYALRQAAVQPVVLTSGALGATGRSPEELPEPPACNTVTSRRRLCGRARSLPDILLRHCVAHLQIQGARMHHARQEGKSAQHMARAQQRETEHLAIVLSIDSAAALSAE